MEVQIPDSEYLRRAAAARYNRDLLTLSRLALTPTQRMAQAQHIRQSHDISLSILDDLEKDSTVDPEKKKIIAEYVRGGIRGAVEGISNFSIRLDYIKAIGESSQKFLQHFREATTVAEVEGIVECAIANRTLMREQMFAEIAGSVRAQQKEAMSTVTKTIKDVVWPSDPKTLDNLVRKLSNGKDFAAMTDQQKLEIYEKLLKNSGKPGAFSTGLSTLQAVVKPAMLVIACTLILHEMSDAWNPAEVATRGMAKLAVDYAAAEVGLVVGVALGAQLAPLLTVALGSNLAGPVGTVVSVIVCTYVLAKVGNAVVDLACDSFFETVSPRIPGFMLAQLEGGKPRHGMNVSLGGQTMSFSLDGGAGLLKSSLLPA